MIAQSSSRGFYASCTCISQTSMPFLYQTKTLSTFSRLCHIARSHQALPSRCRKSLHTSVLSSNQVSTTFESDIPIRKVPFGKVDSGTISRQPRRYPSRGTDYKNSSVGRTRPLEDIPWEEDLQSPNVGGETFVAGKESIPFENVEDIDNDGFTTYAKLFEEDGIFEDDIKDAEYLSEPVVHTRRDSTITVAERHAFQRIFADILARSKSAPSDLNAESSNKLESDKHLNQRRKKKDEIDSVLAERIQAKTNGVSTGNKSREELQAAVSRYPQPLREAAAKAMGLVSERSAKATKEKEEEIISVEVDLEHIRQPERIRVEGLMRTAKTDVELWQVMESEVFSMVEKLGFGEKPAKQTMVKKTHRKTKKQGAEAVKTKEESADPPQNHDQTQDLTTYGPLYPSHLLLGLRLLDRSFEKPSPLVLNVLPRIRSLGVISHVLGASTALYNELLRIYCFRYDNFLGAANLLREMDQAGLEFDAETFEIVGDIHSMQARVRRGDRGSVLQALWALPEFAPGKFKPWKDKIQASLEERGSEGPDEVSWNG